MTIRGLPPKKQYPALPDPTLWVVHAVNILDIGAMYAPRKLASGGVVDAVVRATSDSVNAAAVAFSRPGWNIYRLHPSEVTMYTDATINIPPSDHPWWMIPATAKIELGITIKLRVETFAGSNAYLWETLYASGTASLAPTDTVATLPLGFKTSSTNTLTANANTTLVTAELYRFGFIPPSTIQLGYQENTDFWLERCVAMAGVEEFESANAMKGYPSAWPNAPSAMATPSVALRQLASELRERLTPSEWLNMVGGVATSFVPRRWTIGCVKVSQGPGNFCVAAACVFLFVQRSPLEYVKATRRLWEQGLSRVAGKPDKALPTSLLAAPMLTGVAISDWIWMVGLRETVFNGKKNAALSTVSATDAETVTHLRVMFGGNPAEHSAVLYERKEFKKASSAYGAGKPVLVDAHSSLFPGASKSKIDHVVAFLGGYHVHDPTTGIMSVWDWFEIVDDDTFFFNYWSWSQLFWDQDFEEDDVEDKLNKFYY